MNISSKWVEVRGLRIRYLNAGDAGSPVVFLHGGGTDSASLSWKLTLGPLAEDHRVFAPDLPGYGESDRPDIHYTTDYYINFLGDFMDMVGIEQASLIGVSMGGGIALGFALRSRQRVNRLVLVDSYGLQTTAPVHRLSYLFIQMPLLNEITWALLSRNRVMTRAALRSIFHNPRVVSEELVDEIYAEVRKTRAGRAFIAFQRSEVLWGGLRTVYVGRLCEINVPTLIVHGAEDRLVPIDCARQAHRLIKDSQLHVMADCGHWPQREKPDEFNRVVSQFLEDKRAT